MLFNNFKKNQLSIRNSVNSKWKFLALSSYIKILSLAFIFFPLFSSAQINPKICSQIFSLNISSENTIYPKFSTLDYDPSNPQSYAYYQRINFGQPADLLERKKMRSEGITDAVNYNFKQLRKDPKLASFSDLALKKSSLKALSWSVYISYWVGLYEPSVSQRAGFLLEKYRLYLKAAGINPDSKPVSFEKMLQQFGYNSLAHGTSVNGLISAILSGALINRKTGGQKEQYSVGAPDFVYLEALPKQFETYFFKKAPVIDRNWWKENDLMPVYLELKTSVLDEVDWARFNIYWMYGKESKRHTIYPTNFLAAFFNMVKMMPAKEPNQLNAGYTEVSESGARNEFMFTQPIDFLKYVKAVHVAPDAKESLLAKLKSLHIRQEIIDLVD